MKPAHLLVALAVVAVGVVLYLFVAEDAARSSTRTAREGGGSNSGRGGTDGEVPGPGGDGAGENASATAVTGSVLVVGGDDAPVANARIEARGPRLVDAVTDQAGKATLSGLAPGFYSLVATSEGRTGSAGAMVAAEKEQDLGTIRIAEVVTIEGTIYSASGVPLPGARVEAVRAYVRQGLDMTAIARAMSSPEEVAARAVSDPDGAYRLRIAAGGQYSLRVNARGFAQEHEPPRVYATAVEGLDFHLFTGTTLAGTVADPDGNPIVGATVLWIGGMAAFTGRVPKAEALTDGAGRFEFTITPVENMALVARKPGYATTTASPQPPLHEVDLVLSPGLTLRLRTVDKEDGTPAPGVGVSVMFRGAFETGETGEDGVLELHNLPSRAPTGGMMGATRQVFASGGGFVPHYHTFTTEKAKDGVVDMGDVELSRGGVLEGRVLDADTDKPIAGANVRAIGGVAPQLMAFGAGQATSDADGAYRMTGVPLGAVRVIARHPDYAVDFTAMELLTASSGRGGKPLFKKGQKSAKHDVRLQAAVSASGIVTDTAGEPVAGARVEVLSNDQFAELFGTNPPPAFTKEDGTFVLKGLRRGTATRLRATHRSYGASEPASTQAGAGTEVALKLAEPIQVHGEVLDANRVPVAGARVSVRRPGAARPNRFPGQGNPAGEQTRPAVTDERGAFSLRNVPSGEVVLTVDHTEFMPAEQALRARPDQPVEKLPPIQLTRGPHLAGEVLDADGKPVPGVHVYATAMPDGPANAAKPGETGRRHQGVRTDKQGRFMLAGLRSGKYTVAVTAPDLWSERQVLTPTRTDLRLRVLPAGRLNGVVMAGGQPVNGANIAVLRRRIDMNPTTPSDASELMRNQIGWARTDQSGRFAIASLPPEGPFVVQIRHDEYATETVESVHPGEQERTFTLKDGVRIGGIVVGPKDKPVSYAIVTIQVDGKPLRNVRTKKDGTWAAGGIPAGAITVRVDARFGGFRQSEAVPVAAGDQDIRLVVEPGANILGTLTGDAKLPLMVEAVDADGKVAGIGGVFGADKRFFLRGLPEGTYAVRVKRGQEVVAVTENVRTGTMDLEIRVD